MMIGGAYSSPIVLFFPYSIGIYSNLISNSLVQRKKTTRRWYIRIFRKIESSMDHCASGHSGQRLRHSSIKFRHAKHPVNAVQTIVSHCATYVMPLRVTPLTARVENNTVKRSHPISGIRPRRTIRRRRYLWHGYPFHYVTPTHVRYPIIGQGGEFNHDGNGLGCP